ncbi:MAG: hypothetical protein Kow0059_22080 [Candidatus Sumerlaeia bacterium]
MLMKRNERWGWMKPLIRAACAGVLVLGLSLPSVSGAQPAADPAGPTEAKSSAQPRQTPAPDIKLPEIVVPDGLAAKYQDRARVAEILRYRRPPQARGIRLDAVPTLPEADYNRLVYALATDEVLYEMAMKTGFVSGRDDLKGRLESMKDRVLIYLYYQKNIEPQITVTDEDLKKYYEENKSKYYKPFRFTMRHIFMSTYVPYTAQEGDTLEGLAEKISHDKDMVKFIISDDSDKQPRWVPPEERETKLFRPLQPGEKLLVPMSAEDKAKVRERMEQVLKELQEGADFEELAKKYSETDQKGVIIGPLIPDKEAERGKPILPEILEAIRKTDVGKFSDIVQTKHGFQIYKVEDKQEAYTQSFEEVKSVIEQTLKTQKRQDVENAVLLELAKQFQSSYQVNRDLLKAEEPAPEEVLVSAGEDLSITMQTFKTYRSNYKDDIKSDEDLLKALIAIRDFSTFLLKKAATAAGIADSDEYKNTLREVNIGIVSPSYLDQIVSDNLPMTEADLRAFYESHKEHYKIPEQVDLYLIGRKAAENYPELSQEEREKAQAKAREELAQKVKNVKTLDDFKKLAAEISDDPSKSNSGGVGLVPVNYRNGFNGLLEKLEVGKVSEPVSYGNSAYVLWIASRKPASYHAFEDVVEQVKTNYKGANFEKLATAVRDKIFAQAGLDKTFPLSSDQEDDKPTLKKNG